MSQYILSIPDGILYACSDPCATHVFNVLTSSGTDMISVQWSNDDRDVFCAGCGVPLGWRRRSAYTLHKEMSSKARRFYSQIHERWWQDVAASQ